MNTITPPSAARMLLCAEHVVTMDDSIGEIRDGAVLIEDGVIAAVGPRERFASIDAQVVEAPQSIVIPGFVDTHRHMWMSLLRASSSDMSLLRFLDEIHDRYGDVLTAEDLRVATSVSALEALDAGITTVLDYSDCVNSDDHAEASIAALDDSGVRAVYAYGMHAFPGAQFDSHDDRLKDATRIRQRYFSGSDQRITMALAMSLLGTVPFGQTRAEVILADELAVLSAAHTGAMWGTAVITGVRELNHRGLLRPGQLHIHCTALHEFEWQLLSDAGAKISIAPETELQMGMGHPPLRRCLEHSIAPALSTDVATVGSGDLFSQMRLALQTQRCIDNDPYNRRGAMPIDIDLSVRDALRWATINGAEALGLDATVGSITPGKRADLVVLGTDRPHLFTAFDPVAAVVLHGGRSDVDTVIVDGRIVKWKGALVGRDLRRLRDEAERSVRRILTGPLRAPRPERGLIDWHAEGDLIAAENIAEAYAHQCRDLGI